VNFNVIAPWYRTLETMAFGNDLQRARVACLDEIGSPRRALIVGEGNGRFLRELLCRQPSIEVDCVDASERMLQIAQRRIAPHACRVTFLRRDIGSWTPPVAEYDLIVTHFFLDCFPKDRLSEIVGKLSESATADANWLLSDFCQPSRGFSRLRTRAWLAVMYRFFRYVARIEARELVDPSPFLVAHGFVRQKRHLFRRGILKSELWRQQFLGSAGC
jgi:SAM-dependent methyltransferase